MGNNENEKRAKAEAAFKVLLEKLDQHTATQAQLAESLDKISELGYDFMQVAINVVDTFEKYEEVIGALIEHYLSKATDKANKITPLLQNIFSILDKVKNLRSSQEDD